MRIVIDTAVITASLRDFVKTPPALEVVAPGVVSRGVLSPAQQARLRLNARVAAAKSVAGDCVTMVTSSLSDRVTRGRGRLGLALIKAGLSLAE